MNKFSDFNIEPETRLQGEKIQMYEVFNRPIVVHGFSISDSKHDKNKGNGKCLCLHISIDTKRHIVFTGSVSLQNAISKVPKETGFPFQTTIVKQDKKFIFT